MRLRTQFLISIIVFALVATTFIASVYYTNVQIAQLHHHRDLAETAESHVRLLDYIFMNYIQQPQNMNPWQNTVSTIDVKFHDLIADATDTKELTMLNLVILDLSKVNDTFNDITNTMSIRAHNQANTPTFESIWNLIEPQTQQLTTDTEHLCQYLAQQERQTNQSYLLLIVTLIISFVAYIVLVFHLILRPTLEAIDNLKRKTELSKQANPKKTVPQQFKDEIEDISQDLEEIVEYLKQAIASKTTLENEVLERKKAEATLRETQQKLQDYANNLEKIVEERTGKIRESERSYRELYESFGEAFIATDWELTIIHWNRVAEELLTVKKEDTLGKKIYDVLPEMAQIDITPYFETLKKEQNTRFLMNTKSRVTGRLSTFEISAYPATQGIIIIIEDITDEEQNKRLSAIGQTAGMVGHDIRNPLQAITSDIYIIREELKTIPQCVQNEGLNESLATIEENIFYINKIISDLQDYTRPLAPVNTKVKLKELLQSAITGIKIPKIIKTRIEGQDNLTICTDADYLKRILGNLIINAIQAMPEGGELTLQAKQIKDKVRISVKDTGVGMPNEPADKIFTPLFTTKSKGQGLGLAVVKRLVEELKGRITYESQKGKGTEFIVELPIEG